MGEEEKAGVANDRLAIRGKVIFFFFFADASSQSPASFHFSPPTHTKPTTMVSILPFTRRGRNGASSATASPAPPQGGGGLAARTKAALSGVGAGGMLGGGGVGRLVPGCGLPHVTLPTVQVRMEGEGGGWGGLNENHPPTHQKLAPNVRPWGLSRPAAVPRVRGAVRGVDASLKPTPTQPPGRPPRARRPVRDVDAPRHSPGRRLPHFPHLGRRPVGAGL